MTVRQLVIPQCLHHTVIICHNGGTTNWWSNLRLVVRYGQETPPHDTESPFSCWRLTTAARSNQVVPSTILCGTACTQGCKKQRLLHIPFSCSSLLARHTEGSHCGCLGVTSCRPGAALAVMVSIGCQSYYPPQMPICELRRQNSRPLKAALVWRLQPLVCRNAAKDCCFLAASGEATQLCVQTRLHLFFNHYLKNFRYNIIKKLNNII